MQVIGTLELLAGQRIEERLREAEHAERLQLARTAAGGETVQALAPLTRALARGHRSDEAASVSCVRFPASAIGAG